MKKIYLVFSLSGLVLSSTLFAQSDKAIAQMNLTEGQKQLILADQKPASHPNLSHTRGSLLCDSVTAETAAGNSFNGNMFDVVSNANVIAESFSVSIDAGTWNIGIWYRTGTFVGNESSSTGWIFLDSAQVVSTTTSSTTDFYRVPVSLNLNLTAGTTYGFYVTATDASSSFNYTNGTAVGDTAGFDGTVLIKQGNGGSYPFGVTYSPRVFNGRMHYCVNTAGIAENKLESISVYPNPANDRVNMDLSAYNGKTATVKIFNTLGQQLIASSFVASGVKTIAVDELPSGIYFTQLTVEGKTSTSKLTIK